MKKRLERIKRIENALQILNKKQDRNLKKVSIEKNHSVEENWIYRSLYLWPILDKLTCLEGWLVLSSRDELQKNNNKFVLPVNLNRIIKITDLFYDKSFVKDTGEVFDCSLLGETSRCTYFEDYQIFAQSTYISDDYKDLFNYLILMNVKKNKDKTILECVTKEPFDAIEIFFDESLDENPVNLSFIKSNRINIELTETVDHKLMFSIVYAIADFVPITEKQYPVLSSKISEICKYERMANVLPTLRADFAEVCNVRMHNVFRTITERKEYFVDFINQLKKLDVQKIREAKAKYDVSENLRSTLLSNASQRQVSLHPENFEKCADQDIFSNKMFEFFRNSDSIIGDKSCITFNFDFFRKLSQDVSNRPSSSVYSAKELEEISECNKANQEALQLNDEVRKNEQNIKLLKQRLETNRNARKEDPKKLLDDLTKRKKELEQKKQQAESLKQQLEELRDFINDRSQRKRWNITFALNIPKNLKINEIKTIGCFNNNSYLNEDFQRGSTYIHEVVLDTKVWTIWTSSYSDEYFVYSTNKLNIVSSIKNDNIQFHTMYPSLQPLSNVIPIDQDNLTAFISGDINTPTKFQLQKSDNDNDNDHDDDVEELLRTPLENLKKKIAEQKKRGELSQEEIDDFWK